MIAKGLPVHCDRCGGELQEPAPVVPVHVAREGRVSMGPVGWAHLECPQPTDCTHRDRTLAGVCVACGTRLEPTDSDGAARCVRDFPSGPCGRPTGGSLFCSTCSPKPTDAEVGG